MAWVVISLAALLASGLTFFSGFGLGTLLLPVFAVFVPVEQAVAMTALVHLCNSLFKVILVGRQADRGIVVRFGLPAIGAAVAGAWLLGRLSAAEPLVSYELLGHRVDVLPVKLVIGLLLAVFAIAEVTPRLRDLEFGTRWLPIGGLVSGFCGGLSGMQGALRAAFLARTGLAADAFVATSAVVACLVDLSRLGVYAGSLTTAGVKLADPLLVTAVVSALAGSLLGRRWLAGMTMAAIRRLVAGLLVLLAAGLATGLC